MMPSDHLAPETLFGYEHQMLSADELAEVHHHISICEACRQTLAQRVDLEGMADEVRSAIRERNARAFPYFAVTAAAILVVSGLAFWFAKTRPTQISANSEAVKEALRAGRVDLPPFLEDLAPVRQVLMGGEVPASVRLISPKATAVLAPRPEFRWEPSDGDWTYRVRVFTMGEELVASSPEIRSAAWVCDADLPAGANYQWQVTATKGSERITLPPPSETPPKFRVLSAADRTRLRDLAARQPTAHLELGVAYAQAGLLDDARRELAAAVLQDPARPDVRVLLDSLSRQR